MYPLLDGLNAWIVRDMVERFMARAGRGEKLLMTGSDEWQMYVLQSAGGHLETVQQEIKKFIDISDAEIARIFEDAGIRALAEDNKVYTRAGDRPLTLSRRMVDILEDTYHRTNGTIHNLTRTTANESQKEFVRLLDEAHMRVITGAESYGEAVRDTVNKLADTQLHVQYPTGHVDTIEVAVLRAVRTGVAQATGNMTIQGMKDREWDLIRVSAHLGARYGDGGENPGNHFWWQGKLYSRSGKSKEYPPFEKTTGYGTGEGLSGWNCRHSFGPGDPDFNPFEDFDKEENKRIYDLSQKQRRMERNIRATHRKLIGQREAIDNCTDPAAKAALEAEYANTSRLLERQNKAYKDFCEENELRPLPDRIQAAKWSREDARRSIAVNKEQGIEIEHKSGILASDKKNEVTDVHHIGSIDIEKYRCVTNDIATKEVVITERQVQHIKARHPNDYERFAKHFHEIVEDPDYILEANKPNTAVILKEIKEDDEVFKTILRLATSTDPSGYKNSIITFMKIDKKDWARLLRNKIILYKKK